MPILASRYFVRSDEAMQHFVFPLPSDWWSRPYEYAWASHFARPGDIVLDAGCGLGHPFKFWLAGVCREVHALDSDPAIMTVASNIPNIAKDFGLEAEQKVFHGPNWESHTGLLATLCGDAHRINYACGDMTKMPYPDGMFDRVFCISVLEHMGDMARGWALAEFSRVLKSGGLAVITFDFPVVELAQLGVEAERVGLKFAGEVDYSLPSLPGQDAIFGYGFHCGRAVLRRV